MLTAEQLYKECEGTLTPAEDPSGDGSQASVYGYLVGTGVAFTTKLNRLNEIQDNGTGRPIEVNIRTPDKVGPGVISQTVPKQKLSDAIDVDELRTVKQGQDPNQPLNRENADFSLFDALALPNDVAITDGLQGQMLIIFDNQNWPVTRAALIAALTQPGSRAQQMQGIQFTTDDLRAADAWGVGAGRPTLYE